MRSSDTLRRVCIITALAAGVVASSATSRALDGVPPGLVGDVPGTVTGSAGTVPVFLTPDDSELQIGARIQYDVELASVARMNVELILDNPELSGAVTFEVVHGSDPATAGTFFDDGDLQIGGVIELGCEAPCTHVEPLFITVTRVDDSTAPLSVSVVVTGELEVSNPEATDAVTVAFDAAAP